MEYKRYIIEVGHALDLHGQDVTKAAQKAVKEAVSHSCLCGLKEVAGVKGPDDVKLEITIGSPFPDQVRKEELTGLLPYRNVEVKSVPGGMAVPGLFVPSLGDKDDSIVIVNAVIVVYVKA
ncbi:MAG: Lin0512 family protein [bacterium]|jgi:uncharacterized protein (TIGR02058 family)